jgi:ribA/ribD-fused uncharacterized protein
MAITSFTGKYRFLSNFHPCVIVYDEQIYQSSEAAYQAAKTLDFELRSLYTVGLMTPALAKKLGGLLPVRPGWEQNKIDVMRDILRIKFAKPDMWRKLAATGDEELIEGNYWNDIFWGVCKGQGQNNLGKLLMEIRSG